MKMDEFGQAADSSWAFSAGLIAGMNLANVTLFMLAAKGILSKDDALWIFDQAAASSANMNLPEVYQRGIVGAYARARANFDAAL